MSDHMVEDLKHNKEGDLHTQSVNSSSKVSQWRDKLSQTQLAEIVESCGQTLKNHEKLTMINDRSYHLSVARTTKSYMNITKTTDS